MCSTESVPIDHEPTGSVVSDGSPTVGKPSDSNNNHQRNPNRRSNKPIMEKRRRARINNCLNELKGILLEAMRKDPARHSKLEKADILELTVSHLKSLHRNDTSNSPVAFGAENIARYRAGFTECAAEVGRFLSSPKAEGIDSTTTTRLIAHLNDCLNNTIAMGGPLPSLSPCQRTTPIPLLSSVSSSSNGPLSSNCNEGTLTGSSSSSQGLHPNTPIISLLPSRLPSGEIAFVVPGFSSLRNCSSNGIQIQGPSPLHLSHHQQQQHYRPLLSPEVPLELTVSSSAHGQSYHGGSTSSPSSSTSSLSPAYSYAPHAHAHSSSYHHYPPVSYQMNQSQQPLALVTPKREGPDMSCWRPW